ncbi:MAG: DMP19 family protein, partial [Planctomycetes bacterium]|nr:DMP19 family protein [Planctomycetota bacterium]
SASTEDLCKKLSSDDGTNLQSYTSYFTVPELKAIAGVFGLDAKGKRKNELDAAVWGFVQDYDKITRALTYGDVFSDRRAADFPTRLRNWMEARHSTKKLADLSPGENTLWLIRYALMDIHGNSFPGFFEGGSDDRPEMFIRALRDIGANKSAKAMVDIGKILFGGDVPTTREARLQALMLADEDEADAFEIRLERCRKIWENAGEDIAALSVRFAAKNPDRFRPD